MSLSDVVDGIRKRLKEGIYTSEALVSRSIVIPILQNIGWDIADPQTVYPEYPIEGRRIDYALCHPRNNPAVFIEVKQVGLTRGGDKQLFEYSFHKGIPLAILTDGQVWHFYLPGGRGNYDERCFLTLNLLSQETEQIASDIILYLAYEEVRKGRAFKAANDAYEKVIQDRKIKENIPKAWQILVNNENSALINLIAEKVEDLCGYKPEHYLVAEFLKHLSIKKVDTTVAPDTIISLTGTMDPSLRVIPSTSNGNTKVSKIRSLFAKQNSATDQELIDKSGFDKRNLSVAMNILKNPKRTKNPLYTFYDKMTKTYTLVSKVDEQ
jgi:hypothetical protein